MSLIQRILLTWGIGVAAGVALWVVDRWLSPSLGTWVLVGVVSSTLVLLLMAITKPSQRSEGSSGDDEEPVFTGRSRSGWVYGEIGVTALGGGALLTAAATAGEDLGIDAARVVPSDLQVTLPILALEVLAIAAVVLGIAMLLLAVIPAMARRFEAYAGPLHALVRPMAAVLAWAALFVGYAAAFAQVNDTGLRATVLVWAGLAGVLVAGVHVAYAAVISVAARR